MSKSAIIYFSWSGHVKHFAQIIAEQTDADLFEIEPVQAYPDDYSECVKRGRDEVSRGIHPPVKGLPGNIEQYDIFYIGSPIWFHTISSPVASALDSIDWTGKTVYPFYSHGGSGAGNYLQAVAAACKGARIKKPFGMFLGGILVKREIRKWLRQ